MIRVEQLRAGYRSGFRRAWRDVIKDVSFHVPRGTITGYLGVNGAGKTTTIKVLVGVNPPAGGSVSIAGHPAGTTPAQRALGYFPEAPFFYDDLTGAELLDFFAHLSGVPRADRSQRAAQLLEEVGLASAGDTKIGAYSKGMRQRIGARAGAPPRSGPADPGRAPGRARPHGPPPPAPRRSRARPSGGRRCSSPATSSATSRRSPTTWWSSTAAPWPTTAPRLRSAGRARATSRSASGSRTPQRATRSRRLLGAEPEAHGDALAVSCADTATANRVADAVRAAGGELVHLEARRPTLEEHFLARFGAGTAP